MLASTSHECSTVSPAYICASIRQHQNTNLNSRKLDNTTKKPGEKRKEKRGTHTHSLSLTFKKMVQASIPGYLKFGPNAHRSPARSGDDDALQDTFHISLLFDTPTTHTRIRKARAEKKKRSKSVLVSSCQQPAREREKTRPVRAHLEIHRPLIQRAILYDEEKAREVGVDKEGTLPSVKRWMGRRVEDVRITKARFGGVRMLQVSTRTRKPRRFAVCSRCKSDQVTHLLSSKL